MRVSPAWAAIIIPLILAILAAVATYDKSIAARIANVREGTTQQGQRIAALEASYAALHVQIGDIKAQLIRIENKIDSMR